MFVTPFLWRLEGWDCGARVGRPFQRVDALNMIAQRHRVELVGRTRSAHLSAAVHAADQVTGLDGFDIPSWADFASSARPPFRNVEDFEPGGHCTGWQHRERKLMPQSSERELAEWGSCRHEFVSCAIKFSHQLFCVLLLRRLRLPPPLSSRSCRCGFFSDIFGHHRASCRRGSLEGVGSQLSEAGGRVATNPELVQRAQSQVGRSCWRSGGSVGLKAGAREEPFILRKRAEQG